MLIPGASVVLPRLWIGDLTAVGPALSQGLKSLNVADQHSPGVSEHHIRIMGTMLCAKVEQLNKTLIWIHQNWHHLGFPVLVHCGTGSEKSPLVVAWFMKSHFRMSLDDAYEWLMAHRNGVQDRQFWIEPHEDV